eukprot:2125786-Rhodomonas_salina.2
MKSTQDATKLSLAPINAQVGGGGKEKGETQKAESRKQKAGQKAGAETHLQDADVVVEDDVSLVDNLLLLSLGERQRVDARVPLLDELLVVSDVWELIERHAWPPHILCQSQPSHQMTPSRNLLHGGGWVIPSFPDRPRDRTAMPLIICPPNKSPATATGCQEELGRLCNAQVAVYCGDCTEVASVLVRDEQYWLRLSHTTDASNVLGCLRRGAHALVAA